ncbi:Uma2 family endonuclease [Planctomicrobium piriforme]|uniref:Endonuclease, Uma2 family (Restriction endonuclease fold) n=1 Tax=Planctomicrobium piriforme TaxID=1576369 RepID=A0A1I3G5S9_9PLAN|nr:Uma2 family endonuclease [Planctomicrobium piriforme]SFI18823.1 Endonuclease, Uma2 family (restriction endonuclease fold) [Planctomicrobium piriforme]
MSVSALKRLSADEYLAIERAAETKSDFYNGVMSARSLACEPEVLIATNLSTALGNALTCGRYRVYGSDLRLKTPTGLYTYPDVTVACGSPKFLDGRRDTLLNPLAIFEVLSPSTEAYDRGKKFEHFRHVDSLQSYVLVARDRRSVEVYSRQESGWLLTTAVSGEVAIPALDVVLKLDELYTFVELPPSEPLPDVG